MRTRNITLIPASELQRVAHSSFEHDQYAFTMSDIANLSRSPQFFGVKSVFRIDKKLIDTKDVICLKIIDAGLIKIDKNYVEATYKQG